MEIDLQKIKDSKSMKELLDFSIINIDKSSGPTSFNVSHYVRRNLNLKKTSHFGTLDPKVTGVVPLSLGRACKLSQYFLGEDKTYVGIMRLHDEIPLERINEVIQDKFIGVVIQMPPVKSAVKRQLRPRTIYEFEATEADGKDILFRVKCEGGTYVRTLCVDLGKELGCEAHMLELRRTNAGIFAEDDKEFPIVSLYDFEKAVLKYKEGNDKLLREMLIPGEIVSRLYPIVELKEIAIPMFYNGSPIHDDELVNEKNLEFGIGKIFTVFSKGKFLGIHKVIKEGNLFSIPDYVLKPYGKEATE